METNEIGLLINVIDSRIGLYGTPELKWEGRLKVRKDSKFSHQHVFKPLSRLIMMRTIYRIRRSVSHTTFLSFFLSTTLRQVMSLMATICSQKYWNLEPKKARK